MVELTGTEGNDWVLGLAQGMRAWMVWIFIVWVDDWFSLRVGGGGKGLGGGSVKWNGVLRGSIAIAMYTKVLRVCQRLAGKLFCAIAVGLLIQWFEENMSAGMLNGAQ